MNYDELVKKLKKPCGRTTGHGDSCSEGWMCKACEEKNQAANAITTLQAELEQCRKDAERYRWLRDGESSDVLCGLVTGSCDELDAAIDKAMESV